jgi:hypothetical protein
MQWRLGLGQDPSDYAQVLIPVRVFKPVGPQFALAELGTYIATAPEAHSIVAQVVHVDAEPGTVVSKEEPGFSMNGVDDAVCLFADHNYVLFTYTRRPEDLILTRFDSSKEIRVTSMEPIIGAAVRDGHVVVIEGANGIDRDVGTVIRDGRLVFLKSGIDRVEEFDTTSGKRLFARSVPIGDVPVLFWQDHFVAVHPDGRIDIYAPDFATRTEATPTLGGSISPWVSNPRIFANHLVASLTNGRIAVINLATLQASDTISLLRPSFDYQYAESGDMLWIAAWRASAWASHSGLQQPIPIYLYDLRGHRMVATIHLFAGDIEASGDRLLAWTPTEGGTLYDVDLKELHTLGADYTGVRAEYRRATATLERTRSVYDALDELAGTGVESLMDEATLDPELKTIVIDYGSWLAATVPHHKAGLQLLRKLVERYPADLVLRRRYGGALLFDYLLTRSDESLQDARAELSSAEYPDQLLSKWREVEVNPAALPPVGPRQPGDRSVSTQYGIIACSVTYAYQNPQPRYQCKLHERGSRRVRAVYPRQSLAALVGQAGVDGAELSRFIVAPPENLGSETLWALSARWIIASPDDDSFGPEYARTGQGRLRWRLLGLPIDSSNFLQALISDSSNVALISTGPIIGGNTMIRALDLKDNVAHIALELPGRMYGGAVSGTDYVRYANAQGTLNYLFDERTGSLAAVFDGGEVDGATMTRLPAAAYAATGERIFHAAYALMLN